MAKILSFDNKLMKIGNGLLGPAEVTPPGPVLPANTVRVRTNDGNPPTKGSYTSYDTATLVSGTTDVYDVYKSGTNFESLLDGCTNIIEILGANTTGVTNMTYMFTNCEALTAIPLFDTSSVINMDNTFSGCYRVESGALALYNQASSQTTPPSNHSYTFRNCGSNTVTGAAELAQIPDDWK